MSIQPPSGSTPPHIPQPSRPPGSGMQKAGRVLMIIAAVFAAIALVCGMLSWLWFRELTSLADNAVEVRNGSAAVQLEPGNRRAIWAPYGAASRCEVAGPDGQILDLGHGRTTTISVKGKNYTRVGGFEAQTAGVQKVTCSGDSAGIIVGKDLDGGDVVRGVFAVIGAIGAGIVGGGLLLLGLLLWLVGRSRH